MWNKKKAEPRQKKRSNMAERRIIIAGGGTGGHIFPALAIAHAIRNMAPDTRFLFVGALGRMEMEKVPEAGFRIIGLDIAGFDRNHYWKNISLPWRLLKSFWKVRSIFSEFRPHAVIGVGGYSSFPVLRFAQSKHIPTILHESNAFAGKSNILLGRQATAVCVAHEGMERFFPANKIRITGNPVRQHLEESLPEREDGIRFFGLREDRPVVLVIGGSLGAKSINEAMALGISRLADHQVQLIWQTGKTFVKQAEEALSGFTGMWTGPFIREMPYAYAAADVVVSRAGAMSVAEIAVTAKPAVFVPYPLAAEDHQTANARILSDRDAAALVPDAEAGASLVDKVLELVSDEEKRRSMSVRAGNLAHRGAAVMVATIVLDCMKKDTKG
jgi:UDP-N-acetylglucosamine--N-acetylmuramyl-(pentapeptide) pyrophosphoryl-undecaprenol N-acetylglucosamine transferase